MCEYNSNNKMEIITKDLLNLVENKLINIINKKVGNKELDKTQTDNIIKQGNLIFLLYPNLILNLMCHKYTQIITIRIRPFGESVIENTFFIHPIQFPMCGDVLEEKLIYKNQKNTIDYLFKLFQTKELYYKEEDIEDFVNKLYIRFYSLFDDEYYESIE